MILLLNIPLNTKYIVADTSKVLKYENEIFNNSTRRLLYLKSLGFITGAPVTILDRSKDLIKIKLFKEVFLLNSYLLNGIEVVQKIEDLK